LFLDEPTNHLDIPAAEILEEALMGFEGTVVLVSHDRRFLENVTTRTISIREGTWDVYPGGFRDFVDASKKARSRAEGEAARKKENAKVKSPEKPSARSETRESPGDERAARRAAFEVEKAEARVVERKKKRITELEDLIAGAETKVLALREQLKEDPAGNWEKIANLAREEQALSRRIETMMSDWSTLNDQVGQGAAGPAESGGQRA
jgi:ATP-binding cassette subfamily F protein 3